MRRAEVVAQVGALGAKGARAAAARGARRRSSAGCCARHRGALPPRRWCGSGASCWRAPRRSSGRFAIAVCEPRRASLPPLAREHFGALTPLARARQPGAGDRRRSARARRRSPCCRCRPRTSRRDCLVDALLQRDEPRIHVVAPAAVLGAAAGRHAGRAGAGGDRRARRTRAARTGRCSGSNCRRVSRARLAAALAAPASPPSQLILRARPGAPVAHALVEVAGFVADDDPRLRGCTAVLRPPVVLGAYAVPDRRSRMTGPRPRPGILDICALCRRREQGRRRQNRVVKLSSNEGAFGVPPGAQAACERGGGGGATAIPTAAPPSCAGRSARASGSIRRGSSAAPGRTS